MARRLDLSSLAEAESVQPVTRPARAAGRLVVVPPARVAPNLINPRTNFGDPEELAALGHSLRRKQLQAIRCVSKGAYIRLFPEHEEQLKEHVDVVIVNGERRYRAALTVDLDGIEAVIDDDLAESRQAFLDAVMAENIDRQNFDPIEEATGINLLVAEFGSADAVAAHYGRHKSWVSQRRSLLKLTPELQDRVRTGALPIRRARELAALPADQQLAALDELDTPVEPRQDDQPHHKPAPVGSKAKPANKKPKKSEPAIPWDSPAAVADILVANMTKWNLEALMRLLSADLSTK
jgi:ParB family chromosome partitioning protein